MPTVCRNPPESADNLPEMAGNGRNWLAANDEINWSDLPENDRRVCGYLSSEESASVGKMSKELGIPARTLRDVTRRLVDKGILVAVGEGRNRVYRLK